MKITALAGGVGGAKFLLGLSRVMDPRDLTIIANTGDDIVLHGLRISPDPDIITYTLAGVVNPETGWGFKDESFRVLEQLARYGAPDWFRLGDQDLATHIYRGSELACGVRLSQIADHLRRSLGVASRILPMSDEDVTTILDTDEGRLHLQDYLVKRRAEPVVRGIGFDGADRARPAPGVIEALDEADAIILCPSNPLISIGPILAVSGIREAVQRRRDAVIAISPIVGGKSLKGPSDKMLTQLGYQATAAEVARLYADICRNFVIDTADADLKAEIEALGIRVHVCPTVMRNEADKDALGRAVLTMMQACARS
jgi:LPPG:FO 2-phospho-L-lactate transferase